MKDNFKFAAIFIAILVMATLSCANHSATFKCQKSSNYNPERECSTSVSQKICEEYGHGCFEQPVAYCYRQSQDITTWCLSRPYVDGLGSSFDSCVKDFSNTGSLWRGFTKSGTFTQCLVTMEECKSWRSAMIEANPPVITECQILMPDQFAPMSLK